ncbi:MAG TPA: hypothetical protein VGM23_02810, partial [Armatimonadota bacterium]
IQLLVDLLPPAIQSVPALTDAVVLTPYAVIARYPGEMESVTPEQHTEAVSIATDIVAYVEAHITERT